VVVVVVVLSYKISSLFVSLIRPFLLISTDEIIFQIVLVPIKTKTRKFSSWGLPENSDWLSSPLLAID
jgi:hypothetical protein